MSDSYTKFSLTIERVTAGERRWLIENAEWQPPECEVWEAPPWWDDDGAEVPFNWDAGNAEFLVHSEECGSHDHAAKFLQAFLQRFRPKEALCLSWSYSGDAMADSSANGGGAAFITSTEIKVNDIFTWAAEQWAAFRTENP